MEQSELKEILDQHQLWIESAGKLGTRAILTGANLHGAILTDANFSGAYLGGANLYGANLINADLTGANLRYAILYGAILTDANLTGANLYCADLTRANLCGANLLGANLTGADLRGAFLEFANLTGADLRGANLYGAILTDAILPDISWIIPGCLVQLNRIKYNGFWLMKEAKYENFVQDSFGFFIQNNPEEGTFDMLVEDRIIRGIPDWVKYSGLKKAS